ncbi:MULTISPECIES: enoyl-CoA hydratase/isomerase family protein [unclassified Shinella]|uniref:enoyl-CoA hydratase/isomerase family protein n=1 Tax=unclassified Shinella TaxID=2643062 RepID=UPI00225CF9C0|nr:MULTISPECIES: enoyl-CoA hydratase/isomerase family protein [unclassified Shinella]MCO5137607.1 enoyl-CoA hydratase/isomerase family protein [Shinella sp.]MDC7257725.1 enoyl-CoA hydratase/isomerase family protein [Shinella sp. YE25]CAI0335533.1 Enoyl-CoA hydratase/carnithine racemase [Rhizobiaceae bacterium]CAK7259838.1 Enoyl-CoA hydratase/carnithine racemase [Shinella sp. WSC3-e]
MTQTDASPILISEDRGPVRILSLNRPDKLNALDTALTQALHDALLAADADEAVRAIVLTGTGRAFCAGADLAEFSTLTPANQDLVEKRADLTCRTQAMMQRLSKPVVSAVRGAAVGGGAGLAIGCDMMVAGTDLKFGYPELKHSIVPALVMTGLQRSLGRKAAFEMVSLGRLIEAEEARALGLVNRIVAPEAVVEAALEIAGQWVAAHPKAMAAVKSLYYRVADLPFDEAMAAGRTVNTQMRSFREEC